MTVPGARSWLLLLLRASNRSDLALRWEKVWSIYFLYYVMQVLCRPVWNRGSEAQGRAWRAAVFLALRVGPALTELNI